MKRSPLILAALGALAIASVTPALAHDRDDNFFRFFFGGDRDDWHRDRDCDDDRYREHERREHYGDRRSDWDRDDWDRRGHWDHDRDDGERGRFDRDRRYRDRDGY